MKTKNKTPISTLIAVTVAFFILVAFSATASATIHNVGPGDSIQAAINAATPGDTIIVGPGTYVEYTGAPGAGCAVLVPFYAEGAGGLTIQSSAGPENTIIDCGDAAWGVQIVSNDITFEGFTVKNAYSVINQVGGNDHVLNNLILTDFVNYGMSVMAAHDCTFSDITIHTNDVSKSNNRLVKGIDMQEYGSGGNTYNTFEDITIYNIETTGTSGTSMGIYLEGDNPVMHPTTGNTFNNVDIYGLTSEDFNCGVYILDTGYRTGTGNIDPYAIEDTTFCGGSIYGFTENGVGVVSRGFYVKGGNKNLDITCFDITGCDEGVYFKSFAGTIPPTFPPTGWINDDSWVASKGSAWVKPRTGTYAAGVEMGTSMPDDYLIMPQQSITSGDTISLYARGSFLFGSANFKLLVSTTGDFINDPYDTLGTYPVTGYMGGSWLAVSEDLSAYNGQNIYIAIYAYEQELGPSAELLIDDVTLPDGTTEGFEGTTTTIGAVDVTVNCNDIHGNTNYGVDNSNGVGTVDAENNWWGDTSGPTHSNNPSGSGDAVSDSVDFDPWIASLIYTGAPQPTTNVVLEATLSDSTPAGMSGYTVDFYVDNVYVGNATTDSDGVASCNIGLYPVGIYDVYASVCCLESDPALLAIYDPAGGFVTGGGWINSPAGAYVPDPDAEGKANFGFVSKYKKGQSTPIGNTEFQFKAGDLNFHSDSYEWLVIAKHKAMYKGTGTINGTGDYGFMLSAIDEKLTPSTDDVDKFRIRIWEEDTNGDETIIYDNQMEDVEDADPTTEIAGGQIVIHKAKTKAK